jgi:hypothetical protein
MVVLLCALRIRLDDRSDRQAARLSAVFQICGSASLVRAAVALGDLARNGELLEILSYSERGLFITRASSVSS